MLGTANVPKPVNIAPGTDGSSTGTKNPLGIPVAFLMSMGSLKCIQFVRSKAIAIKSYKHNITEAVLLLGQFFIQWPGLWHLWQT